MLKILLEKYFLFQNCKNKHNENITKISPYPLSKSIKLLSLIPENRGDRAFIVCKTGIGGSK